MATFSLQKPADPKLAEKIKTAEPKSVAGNFQSSTLRKSDTSSSNFPVPEQPNSSGVTLGSVDYLRSRLTTEQRLAYSEKLIADWNRNPISLWRGGYISQDKARDILRFVRRSNVLSLIELSASKNGEVLSKYGQLEIVRDSGGLEPSLGYRVDEFLKKCKNFLFPEKTKNK